MQFWFWVLWCQGSRGHNTIGQLTAMDSAPAPKATSPKKLRSHSNEKTDLEQKQQDLQDVMSSRIWILIMRTLMPRMQGPQHHVACWLPWIHPLLQKQLLQRNSGVVPMKKRTWNKNSKNYKTLWQVRFRFRGFITSPIISRQIWIQAKSIWKISKNANLYQLN